MVLFLSAKIPSGLSADENRAVKDVLQRLVTALGVRFGGLTLKSSWARTGCPMCWNWEAVRAET